MFAVGMAINLGWSALGFGQAPSLKTRVPTCAPPVQPSKVGESATTRVAPNAAKPHRHFRMDHPRRVVVERVVVVPQPLPTVMVQSRFGQQVLAWHEQLTLTEALEMAQCVGRGPIHAITVVRERRRHAISPRQLERGEGDLFLLPWDLVVVR